jgi:hypothetical protein
MMAVNLELVELKILSLSLSLSLSLLLLLSLLFHTPSPVCDTKFAVEKYSTLSLLQYLLKTKGEESLFDIFWDHQPLLSIPT